MSAETCILLATYNERPNLERLLPVLLDVAPQAFVIVVDDNSPDGSPDLLRGMAASNPRIVPLIRPEKQGYGGAVLAGLRHALDLGAQRIVTMDADFSHDPADVPRLVEGLERGDVAIGSRYFQGVRVLNWHPSRLLLSLFANRYVKAILGLRVDDATSGFRAYRRAAAETVTTVPIRSRGYSFLVELLFRVHKAGFTLVEVPIIYSERREGQSKMSKGVIFEAMFRPWALRFGPNPKQ
jgi:dolichol-phosphate mannosyltransferase